MSYFTNYDYVMVVPSGTALRIMEALSPTINPYERLAQALQGAGIDAHAYVGNEANPFQSIITMPRHQVSSAERIMKRMDLITQ